MPRSPQELYKKMGLRNLRLGAEGESKACRFLKSNGWEIIERNYKNPFGEVDVIARKDGIYAFVEVKTRLSESFGQPSEAVNRKRRQKYISAAKYYFSGRQTDFTIRFDIIEILRGEINHIENAFY